MTPSPLADLTTDFDRNLQSLSLAEKLAMERLLDAELQQERLIAQILRKPSSLLNSVGGADPWQAELLKSWFPRMLLLCTRQGGKSSVAAAIAIKTALAERGSLTLLLSPTQRQSSELFRDKVMRLYNTIGKPVPIVQESALTMTLATGSRIVALPGDEETIRGYSGVKLLVLDEAARISDELYRSVRPMLAVSQGRLIALSTPFGRRGWFFEEWSGSNEWKRVKIQANQCPRISPAFLAEERAALGERWYRQEYEVSFEDTIAALFAYEDLAASLRSDVPTMVLPE